MKTGIRATSSPDAPWLFLPHFGSLSLEQEVFEAGGQELTDITVVPPLPPPVPPTPFVDVPRDVLRDRPSQKGHPRCIQILS